MEPLHPTPDPTRSAAAASAGSSRRFSSAEAPGSATNSPVNPPQRSVPVDDMSNPSVSSDVRRSNSFGGIPDRHQINLSSGGCGGSFTNERAPDKPQSSSARNVSLNITVSKRGSVSSQSSASPAATSSAAAAARPQKYHSILKNPLQPPPQPPVQPHVTATPLKYQPPPNDRMFSNPSATADSPPYSPVSPFALSLARKAESRLYQPDRGQDKKLEDEGSRVLVVEPFSWCKFLMLLLIAAVLMLVTLAFFSSISFFLRTMQCDNAGQCHKTH